MGTEYRPSARDRLRVRLRRRVLHRLRALVEPDGARLLDLGGGTGATTVEFGRGARELVVLEPNERRIARGKAANVPVRLVLGAAETIPFPTERFDRVVSLMSFHHFPDGDAALRESSRVLVPGGRLVIFDLDPSTRSGRWVALVEGRISHHAFRFAPWEELEQRARAAGFREVHRESFRSGAFVVAVR